MYILLLWIRYLQTRKLAWLSVLCIMLGVATLIVVNSVMGGFSTKLKDRLHGMLSDIVIEASDPVDGFPLTADEMMERIRESPAGAHIAAMSPTIETFALLQFQVNGHNVAHRVMLIGLDPELQQRVGGFHEHIVDPERKARPSFDITPEAQRRFDRNHPPMRDLPPFLPPPEAPRGEIPQLAEVKGTTVPPVPKHPAMDPPPSTPKKYRGIILGHAIAHYRSPPAADGTVSDICFLERGDTVKILTVGGQLEPVFDEFIVCDYLKSEMSDYDGSYAFVPLDYLQKLRHTEGRTNMLQIKLHHYDTKHAQAVRDALQQLFGPWRCKVSTWEDKQGALLAAISVERGILNILLFLIVGVAGFGILSIFSTLVTEKTRDIGILKALGASNQGVARIFLGYGAMLGVVGALLGVVMGLLLTTYINEIEQTLTKLTGKEIFDRSIYYFNQIPTDIQPVNIAIVACGAVLAAVISSFVPALRAAWLRPVRALRFE